MKKMKVPGFSFHTEPFWMLMGSVVPAVIGILIVLLVALLRKFVL
jgi:hypothetical protein